MFNKYNDVKLVKLTVLDYGLVKCIFKLKRKKFLFFNESITILAFKPLIQHVNKNAFSYIELGRKKNSYINCFLCDVINKRRVQSNPYSLLNLPSKKSNVLFGNKINEKMNQLFYLYTVKNF